MALSRNPFMFLFLLVNLTSSAQGIRCEVYGLGGPHEDIPEGHFRNCILSPPSLGSPTRLLCKTYRCPEISSCQETVVGDNLCSRCIDECQWAGFTFKPNERGLCEDGFNTCTCKLVRGRTMVTKTSKECGWLHFCLSGK